MMIDFKDFAPQIKERGFFKTEFQTFGEALAAANQWIADSKINVVNVETVVLPEIWSEDGTEDPCLRSSGEMSSSWYQFIRVWFEWSLGERT